MAYTILTGRYIRSTFIMDQSEFIENLQIGKQIGKILDIPKRPQTPKPFFCFYFCFMGPRPLRPIGPHILLLRSSEIMRNYAKLCETMRNYSKLCGTMQNYSKLCKTMRNYANLCETILCETMRVGKHKAVAIRFN